MASSLCEWLGDAQNWGNWRLGRGPGGPSCLAEGLVGEAEWWLLVWRVNARKGHSRVLLLQGEVPCLLGGVGVSRAMGVGSGVQDPG